MGRVSPCSSHQKELELSATEIFMGYAYAFQGYRLGLFLLCNRVGDWRGVLGRALARVWVYEVNLLVVRMGLGCGNVAGRASQ